MSEENQAPAEVIAYFAYMGKRIPNGKDVLQDAYIEVDAEGKQIGPEDLETHWVSKKFHYAKRPHVGAIYKVKFTAVNRSRIRIEADSIRYHGQVDAAQQMDWALQHKAAQALDAKRLAMNKDLAKDKLESLSLGELRAKMRTSSNAQRLAILAIVIDYIQK